MKTLIFPYVGKEAEDYLREALTRCEQVVTQPPKDFPTIHHPDFAEVFYKLVTDHGITHLYCPVASVHMFMETFQHSLILLGESPIKRQMREHDDLMKSARELMIYAGDLSLLEVAGVLKAAMAIYGESNQEKLVAMMGVFSSAPSGDVIEVGCLCGRTAYVLRWLAIRYGHFMMTVDPWSPVSGIQEDSPPLLAAMTHSWDWDVVAEIFAVNMVPLGHFNHLRTPSDRAFTQYADSDQQAIAVLHIDGNHDFVEVRKDIDLWCSCLQSGGWLILDDYRWAHGNGPYRAGNMLLTKKRHQNYFEAGGALFVQMR